MKKVFGTLAMLMAALVAALAAAACAQEKALPEVAVGAADYSFTAPSSLAGGLVRVKMANTGAEAHHVQFLRLNDGVTLQQFQDTLQAALQAVPTEGEAALGRIFALVTFVGGPASVGPGGANEAVLNLAEGQHVLVCFVPSPADGVPHLAKGMVYPVTVTSAAADQPPAPKTDVTVELNDYAFVVTGSVKPGKTTVTVVNKGKEPHEMPVLLLKGINVAQLGEILSAPPGAAPAGAPPFADAGGLQAIMPGQTAWVTLDLQAGEYTLVCFVPSPANEFKPHFALGMIRGLTVK